MESTLASKRVHIAHMVKLDWSGRIIGSLYVRYHSQDWTGLVSQGWFTDTVDTLPSMFEDCA